MDLGWIDFITPNRQSPIAPRLWASVAGLALYTAGVVFVERTFFGADTTFGAELPASLGAVLGLLLVFRSNTAYDRWWEGRKLWGQLVNELRNLSILVGRFLKVDREEAKRMGELMIAFAFALKDHLRSGVNLKDLPAITTTGAEPKHVPSYVDGLIYEQIQHWRLEGSIDGYETLVLDAHARTLMDICGACERIRSSPISRSYRIFIRQCIGFLLITLPWGLIHDLAYWAIPVVAAVAYFMIGVELIAEDVEEPFGLDGDDLPLDSICATIEASVREILNLPSAPEGVQ